MLMISSHAFLFPVISMSNETNLLTLPWGRAKDRCTLAFGAAGAAGAGSAGAATAAPSTGTIVPTPPPPPLPPRFFFFFAGDFVGDT